MDFKSLKEKAVGFKDKVVESSAKTLQNSSITISKKESLEKIIKSSKTTKFKPKDGGEERIYKHKAIVVFAEENSDFFKKALYMFPVLVTKAFSQNIKFRLAKSNIEGVDLEDYKVEKLPTMVVFEEEKVLKTIEGEENILKLVKSFDLDINKLMEKL